MRRRRASEIAAASSGDSGRLFQWMNLMILAGTLAMLLFTRETFSSWVAIFVDGMGETNGVDAPPAGAAERTSSPSESAAELTAGAPTARVAIYTPPPRAHTAVATAQGRVHLALTDGHAASHASPPDDDLQR